MLIIPRRGAMLTPITVQMRLEWDTGQMMADMESGFDFDGIFYKDELERMFGNLPDDDAWADAFDGLPDEDRAPFRQMTFTLHDAQVGTIIQSLRIAKSLGEFAGPNKNNNGNALARVCELFMVGFQDDIS